MQSDKIIEVKLQIGKKKLKSRLKLVEDTVFGCCREKSKFVKDRLAGVFRN